MKQKAILLALALIAFLLSAEVFRLDGDGTTSLDHTKASIPTTSDVVEPPQYKVTFKEPLMARAPVKSRVERKILRKPNDPLTWAQLKVRDHEVLTDVYDTVRIHHGLAVLDTSRVSVTPTALQAIHKAHAYHSQVIGNTDEAANQLAQRWYNKLTLYVMDNKPLPPELIGNYKIYGPAPTHTALQRLIRNKPLGPGTDEEIDGQHYHYWISPDVDPRLKKADTKATRALTEGVNAYLILLPTFVR